MELAIAVRSSLRLNASSKHVLCALLEREGRNGATPGRAYATQRELGLACGVSHITAGRAIDDLLAKGAFERIVRIYPRQTMPDGRISENGCTIFVFDERGIRRLAEPFTPPAGEPSMLVQVLEQLVTVSDQVAALSARVAAFESVGHARSGSGLDNAGSAGEPPAGESSGGDSSTNGGTGVPPISGSTITPDRFADRTGAIISSIAGPLLCAA